jgi:tRNA-2-methylthio-N6-dimethylallyladenosine synthase
VHLAAVEARPGDMVTAEVTYAAPHHLVADKVTGVRRTRAGDAWEARQGRPASGNAVSLGMPTIGRPPAQEPVQGGCAVPASR